MKSTVAVLLLLGVVGVCFAGIDTGDCTQKKGNYGILVECDAGYAAVALCTSGRNADCDGHYTDLKCCRETEEGPAARTCNTLAGNHGVTLNCNDGFLVMGVCSSGTNGDCGGGAFTQIMCCDDHQQNIDSQCQWFYGDYGRTVTCGVNEVITSVCSSGRNADCAESSYTGIKCCEV